MSKLGKDVQQDPDADGGGLMHHGGEFLGTAGDTVADALDEQNGYPVPVGRQEDAGGFHLADLGAEAFMEVGLPVNLREAS